MATRITPLPPPPEDPAGRPTGQLRVPPAAGGATPEETARFTQAVREAEQRRYYGDTSYGSPLNQAIAEQRKIATGGFTPRTPAELAAYNLAVRQQPTFGSPAQAYMLQRSLERGLLDQARPAQAAPRDSVGAGLDAGQQSALEQNQEMSLSGLLGNVDWQGLLRVLARPEFLQPGVSPAQAFVGASFAQRQADAASRAAAQAQQLEYDKLQADLVKEQLKATPQPPKPSAEITQLYTKIASGQESLKALNKMQGIMSGGITTGGAALGIDFLTNLAAAFNINIGETDKTNLNRQVDKVRAALIASRAFGREANKQEQKLIENLLPKGATFTNVDELRNAYRDFQEYIENDLRVTSGILQNVYQLPSFSQVVPPAFKRGNR